MDGIIDHEVVIKDLIIVVVKLIVSIGLVELVVVNLDDYVMLDMVNVMEPIVKDV